VRVLLTDQFSELGGAQRGLLEAAEGFAARDWELHAVIPEGPLVEGLRRFCSSISIIPCGPYQSFRKTARDVLRFAVQFQKQSATMSDVIRRNSVDVLYVNGPRVLPAAAWARSGRPIIFHSHSIVTQPRAAQFAGLVLRWSGTHVLASSKFVSSWLAPFVPPDHIDVIYNGIRDLARTPQARGRHTRIGVLGRIAPEKGQLTFVRAARIAADADPSLQFVIAGAPVFAGKDYLNQVQNEAGPHVRFTGWTDNIGEFFDQIDLLVVPSEGVDANPRVIPEAYAAGIPVLAFDSGGVSELIDHNQTGLLVQERSSRSLAAAMLEAVRHPVALNRMALHGHQRWRERYTLPRFQSEVCEALERVVAVRAPIHKARVSANA